MKNNNLNSPMKLAALLTTSVLLTACGGGSDNNEPELEAIQAQLNEDTSWQQTINFSGTPIVITAPQNGEVSVGAALVTYTPDQDYNGTDSVLIEAGNTRYSISFNVAPVNDAPQLQQSTIEVAADNLIEGQINATDVDGDSLTFTLANAPESGTLQLQSDGTFTLAIDTLTLPNQSFAVDISDGQATTTATVTLKPAYSTNEEKAAYYYRSDKSHLKAAEQRLQQIDDDIVSANAYSALLQGYARAGLDTEVERLFNHHITGQQARAVTLKDLGDAYAEANEPDLASAARLDALKEYAQFIADNGLENISSTDALFLLTLLNRQIDAGDEAGAEQTIQQLNVYTSTIGGAQNEYSTAYGRLVTAYRNQVRGAIEHYQQQRTPENRTRAITAIDRFTTIVANTGYQLLTRGDYAGERAYKLAPLYSAMATEYYILVGATEAARAQLAETISYYGDVSYDANYAREAKAYAQVSLADYTFPLVDASAAFAILYPELPVSENVPFQLIPSDSIFYSRAEDAVSGASALALVLNGGSVNDAISQLKTEFGNDLRDLQVQLTQNTPASPYLGAQLLALGYTDEAAQAFTEGLSVLTSSAYAAENGGATLYMTGTRGCLKYVQLYQSIDSLDATAAAAACETMATTYFNTVEGDVSLSDVVNAHFDAVTAWQALGESSQALSLLDTLETTFASLPTTSADQFDFTLEVAQVRAYSGDYTGALNAIESALNQAQNNESLTAPERANALLQLAATFNSFDSDSAMVLTRYSVLQTLRRNAYNHPEYADFMARSRLLNGTLARTLATTMRELPEVDAIDEAADVTLALAAIREYSLASELLNELPLGSAERLTLTALISELQALQDDFPASIVASVDTDQDGLANFLAVSATEEQLADNDIATDNDADNDGVEDANDPTPLG
ncbi:Ig-like domain-containing protein [Pseudidiomarina insulisalsae]|uniref:RapA2 cadherin-like domain-containing protein n=1 Tax=Pseudidiomarina insulisalsae TaxID=575789 RepID=A0A432YLT9_9GAMM|nr:Ig-like domain-containing protein [Pseudidiomarina insulisalsae]RUO61805.1 hypothetical protein CWI71_05440 [Pseudidiomarina insulisalsae]